MPLSDLFSILPPAISKQELAIVDMLPMPALPEYSVSMPRKKQTPKHLGFGWEAMSRPGWEKPAYNLTEIAQATKVESYVQISINKHREHTLRHGWRFVGKNPKAVAYVHRRLRELSESMLRPVEQEIRQAIANYIKYSNFFLAWTRDRNVEYKSRYNKNKFRPTGIFSMNPTCMRFRRDVRNRVLEWYQVVTPHSDEVLKPVDVVHGAFDRDDGYILGAPYLLPVLDDIIAWRRFEEIAEKMYHKFTYPLYHHTIGTKERDPETYDNGVSEISEAASAIAGMAPEGHLVTSYRHSVEVIGAKDHAIDLDPILHYWEARVLAGLNLSTLDIGRGDSATRNTAETLSKGLAERCAEYQENFAELFTFFIIDELLLEGGFELTPETRVYMYFPPIDRESKRSEDTHQVFMYQASAITHDEMRISIGLEPFTDEQWKETQYEQMTVPLAEMSSAPQEGSASAASTTNKAKPTNQHGTKATKTRVKKDTQALCGMYRTILHDGAEDYVDSLIKNTRPHIVTWMQQGVQAYNADNDATTFLGKALISGFMDDCVATTIKDKTKAVDKPLSIVDTMSLYADLFRTAAINYAYVRVGQAHKKHTHVKWKITDSACTECSNLQPIRIRRFTLGQMIPKHDTCVSCLEFIEEK